MSRIADSPRPEGPLDGLAQAKLIADGEASAHELVEAAIAKIESLNPDLNAVVTPLFDQAREQARSGALPEGPFRGVPFLVKDLIARVGGARLTNGSAALAEYVPPEDSELVRRYRRAGLVILGKTNTSEFGATPVTESEFLGPARNPSALERTPGGSSGGSAAAVASGMVALAHGNDGGGSIRIPASCCGVFGLKPSRGRNPLEPAAGDMAGRIICEHALTRSVRDSAALLDATAGSLPGSAYIAPEVPGAFLSAIARPPGRLRIALSTRPIVEVDVHADCRRAVESTALLCEELGHEVVEDEPVLDGEQLVEAWFRYWAAFNAAMVAGVEEHTGQPPCEDQFEQLTWRYFEQARERTMLDHLRTTRALDEGAASIAGFLEQYDAWLTPTLAQPPLEVGGFYGPEDTVKRYVSFSPFLRLANLTGTPAMSVPLYWSESGMPIGSHFMASHGHEGLLLRLARQLEEARPWMRGGDRPGPRDPIT